MLRKFLYSIVYSHLWIATCAAALILQTQYLLSEKWSIEPITKLVFGGTLLIYALHRIIGLQKLNELSAPLNSRYIIIQKNQPFIALSIAIGTLIAALAFFEITPLTRWWLLLPGLISLAYVLPIPWVGKRLRDIGMIKLFLIAFVYGLVISILPFIESQREISTSSIMLMAEKSLFILAITVPFDIRDIQVDDFYGTKTLPSVLGEKRAKRIALFATALSALFIIFNPLYTLPIKAALFFSLVIAVVFIQASSERKDDLFFSFGMDGLMVLQTVLFYFATTI